MIVFLCFFEFLLHPDGLAQIMKESDGGNLLIAFIHNRRIQTDWNFFTGFFANVYLVGFQFASAAVFLAAELTHNLPGAVARIDIPDG